MTIQKRNDLQPWEVKLVEAFTKPAGELIPPTRYYHGPITGNYWGDYTADIHCASCGSTSVSKPSYKAGAKTFKCTKCGRKTKLAKAATNAKDAVYEIRVQGYTEKEGLRRDDLEDNLWDVLERLDDHLASEVAHAYFGPYYDGASQIPKEPDWAESRKLECDILWANKCMALDEGYVDGLEVGEEYKLPDYPVTIARVGDRTSGSSASSNRRPSLSNSRKTPTKTISKNTRSKAGTKTPATKTTSKTVNRRR